MKLFAIGLLLASLFVTSGVQAENTVRSKDEKAALLKATKNIVCAPNGCEQDDDFYTVQYVLAKRGDDTPSHVSEDGQIIFLNSAYKPEASAITKLIEQSLERRLARMPDS